MTDNNPEIIREKIDRLIADAGLNYRAISQMMGKSEAYMQQYIKLRCPLRLKEVDRKKLAKILKVPEQELTDLPVSVGDSTDDPVDTAVLTQVIANVENWLEEHDGVLSPQDKAHLISLIYKKVIDIPELNRVAKIIDFMEVYDSLKKAN